MTANFKMKIKMQIERMSGQLPLSFIPDFGSHFHLNFGLNGRPFS